MEETCPLHPGLQFAAPCSVMSLSPLDSSPHSQRVKWIDLFKIQAGLYHSTAQNPSIPLHLTWREVRVLIKAVSQLTLIAFGPYLHALLTHNAPAMLAPSLFHRHTQHAPSSVSLCLLFHFPGASLSSVICIVCSLPSGLSSNVSWCTF